MKKKKHRGTVWEATCLTCGEGITNPLCPECLEEEIEEWVATSDPLLVPYLKDLAAITVTSGMEESFCIKCGDRISVCTYCFTQEAMSFILEKRPELAASFAEHFGMLDVQRHFSAM